MTNLKAATAAMESAVSELGGIDLAIEACDRMYNATFRSEPFTLSDEEIADQESALIIELAAHLYISETGNKAPVPPQESYNSYCDDDYELESYHASMEAFEEFAEDWFANKYPDFKITKDTLVVCFCNYKGEGEGQDGLYDLHKHLPVFVSKSQSFNAVNQESK